MITGNGTGSSGGRGVTVILGSSADIEDAEISSNHGDGLGVFANSILFLRGSTVSANTGNGIVAFNGSTLDIRDTTVSDSGTDGVQVDTNSSLILRSTTSGVTAAISNNARNGVNALFGSAIIVQTVSITGNGKFPSGGYGINCKESRASVDRSGVTGNLLDLSPDPGPGVPFPRSC